MLSIHKSTESFLEKFHFYSESCLSQVSESTYLFVRNFTTEVESRHSVRGQGQELKKSKAKDRLLKHRPFQGQGQEWSKPRPSINDTSFLNYCGQIFDNFSMQKCLRHCILLSSKYNNDCHFEVLHVSN